MQDMTLISQLLLSFLSLPHQNNSLRIGKSTFTRQGDEIDSFCEILHVHPLKEGLV